jgi:flagellar M-ring protein FliF
MSKDRLAPSGSKAAAGRGPATGRAGKPLTAVLVLSLAGCACLAASPAYAASGATQRQAILNSHTVPFAASDGPTGTAVAGAPGRALSVRGEAMAGGTEVATTAYQQRLNNALQTMLDAVVGPGRAVVTTNVELDFDQVETISTTYTQDASAGALSEKVSRRSYTDTSGSSQYESSSVTRANALNSLRETRRNSPGDIVKLNIAVLIDAVAAENIDLAQVKELVGVAAGIEPSRGDAVTVAAIPLHSRQAATGDSTVPQTNVVGTRSRLSVLVTAALAMLILGLLVAGWRYKDRATRNSAQRDRQELLRSGLQQQRPSIAVASVLGAPTATAARRDSVERQHEISRFVELAPDHAAAQLRDWVENGR